MSRSADTRKLLKALERDGVLLIHDKVLPSATSIIAGEPVRGSWWSHPLANDIYDAMQPLDRVATRTKLVAEKETFVHERLWPALVTIGASRARWQLDDLPAEARGILASTSRSRLPKPAKDLAPTIAAKSRQRAVRLLELRLLVQTYERHTESGTHAKYLQTWRAFARAHDITPLADAARARMSFEAIVADWPHPGPRPLLPWLARGHRPRN